MQLKRFTGFILAIGVLGCNLLQREAKRYTPDLRLLDIKLANYNFDGIDLAFQYQLINKAPFPITFNKVNFDLFADKKQVISSELPKGLQVAAKAHTNFEIVHRVKFFDLVASILDLSKKSEFLVELRGKTYVFLNQALGSVEVPFEAQKIVSVPKLPSVSFKNLEFKSAELNIFNPRANFVLHFQVKNPNSFDAKLKALSYGFRAENADLISGALQNISLPAGQEVSLSVPLQIKGSDVISLVPKLRDFEKLNYVFSGEMNLDVLGNILKIPYQYP